MSWLIIFKEDKKQVIETKRPYWKKSLLGQDLVFMAIKEDLSESDARTEVYKTHKYKYKPINIYFVSCSKRPNDFNPFTEVTPKEDHMVW